MILYIFMYVHAMCQLNRWGQFNFMGETVSGWLAPPQLTTPWFFLVLGLLPATNNVGFVLGKMQPLTPSFSFFFSLPFFFFFSLPYIELSGDDSPKSFLSSFSCQQQTSRILPFKLQRFPPFSWLLCAAIFPAPSC